MSYDNDDDYPSADKIGVQSSAFFPKQNQFTS